MGEGWQCLFLYKYFLTAGILKTSTEEEKHRLNFAQNIPSTVCQKYC